MKRMDDYEILEYTSKYDLEIEVIKYVNEKGYELVGGPFYKHEKDDLGRKYDYICQAVAKYIEN